jgi:putative ABC transport system ATP-binding protein
LEPNAVIRDAQPMLRVESVSRVFRMGDVAVTALAEANLDIAAGDFVGILGPSGSGKSTLLNLVGGTDRPTDGHVWFGEKDLAALSDAELTQYRRSVVGFIFQFYNLVPTLTAEENVQVATELVDDPLPPADALAMVGLSDRHGHFPAQLSGGEQQRVAIARAIAKRPRLLLADEPTGALDLPTAREVLSILQRLNRDQQLTILLITHNPALADITHKVVRLASGRITEIRINPAPIEASEVVW